MKVMLIGGGEIGKANTSYETKEIDEEIVKMSERNNPNFLFVGLASPFSDSYYDVIKNIYKDLGCTCGTLRKRNIINNFDNAVSKIKNADIIYFGGGDTLKLIEDLKEYKLESYIKEALDRGIVLAGISAGAIMLCNEGYSDSLIIRGESDKYDFIKGLGFVPINFSPHHSGDKRIEMANEVEDRIVYGLENNVALKIIDNNYEVIKSDKKAKAYLISLNGEEELNGNGVI